MDRRREHETRTEEREEQTRADQFPDTLSTWAAIRSTQEPPRLHVQNRMISNSQTLWNTDSIPYHRFVTTLSLLY